MTASCCFTDWHPPRCSVAGRNNLHSSTLGTGPCRESKLLSLDFTGDSFIDHQADFYTPVLRTSRSRLVLSHRLEVPVTKWLDQALHWKLVLAHQVVDHRVSTSFAQIPVALRIAARVGVPNHRYDPALGVLG